MSTPARVSTAEAAPVTDSPGTWRHPRLNEITRRKNATNFSEKNVRRIAYNLVALIVLWGVQLITRLWVDHQILPATVRFYLGWAWCILKILPFVQIGLACMPLLRAQDDLSDIPLTATQRKLLGLPPTSAQPGLDISYSTPPRYSRTPSMAGSVGSRASYNSSPLSGRGSPALQASGGATGSPFSNASSPLLQRSLNGFANQRRSSFGSSGPFNASSSVNPFAESTSTSPSGGKRTSVGLNNKWLYERGRRSSGSTWLH